MSLTNYPLYDGVAGSPATTLTTQYNAGVDTTITVANASVLEDGPNLVTISTSSGDFVTVLYTTKSANTLSGLTPKTGSISGVFPAGSYAARRYSEADDSAIKDNLREIIPEVDSLEGRVSNIENNNQVIISATTTQGGTISPSGAVGCFKGTSRTFTIGTLVGYLSWTVKVDGVSVGQVSTYTFEDIQEGHTIQVIPVVPTVYSMTITPANETDSTSGVSNITASDGTDVSTQAKRLAIYDTLVPPFLIPRNNFANKKQLKPANLAQDTSGNDVTASLATDDLFRGAQPIWWNVTGNGTSFRIDWTTGQRDDWMTAHKVGDQITSRLYLGVFGGTSTTSGSATVLQSCYNTSAILNTKSNDTFTQYAWNCGDTYNEETYLTHMLWQILLVWCYGVLNFQNKVAQGYNTGGSSASSLHTNQTNFSLTGGDTQGSTSDSTIDAVVGGIKNFYGHQWIMLGGARSNAGVVTLQTDQADRAKVTAGSSTWQTLAGTLPTSSNYIKTTKAINAGPFLPATVGGSSSTYLCDYYYYSATLNQLRAGGACSDGAFCGPFALTAHTSVDHGGYWGSGARLQAYEPVA